MKTPEDVIRIARTYTGTPFHLHARLKGIGIDCAGLLICVGRELGFDCQDFTNYRHQDQKGALLDAFKVLKLNPLPAACVGSILTFKFNKNEHTGILTGTRLLHTSDRLDRVVEVSYDHRWQERTESVWGFPNVDYGV